jgi:hypothetical protein
MSSGPSPKELYQSCTTREQNLNRAGFDHIRELLTKELIFRPLFAIDSDSAATNAGSKDRTIDEAIWRGSKYRDLLELLGKYKKIEARWILVARWLRQEGICEPEQFLPKEMNLKSLTRKLWRGTRRQDFFHVARIEIWWPYFLMLLQDRDRLEAKGVRRMEEELQILGYDVNVIVIAVQERSPREAIYSWLSSRGVAAVEDLRNAYSRASGAMKSLTPEVASFFCAKENEELGRLGLPTLLLTNAVSSRNRKKVKIQNPSTRNVP